MAFEYDSNELRNRRGEDLVVAFERLVAGYHSILEKEGISTDAPAAWHMIKVKPCACALISEHP